MTVVVKTSSIASPSFTVDDDAARPASPQAARIGTVAEAPRSAARRWVRWARQPGLVLSALFLLLIVAWAVAPTVFAPFDPVTDLDATAPMAAPSSTHWFGTDPLGRDIYSRTVHGTRLSVVAALIAVTISVLVGGFLGLVSGYVGGWLDVVFMRGVDIMVAIPGLLLSLVAVSVLGFGVVNVAVAVGIAGIPAFARLARAEAMRIASRPYLDAARTSGVGGFRILVQHVVPNAWGAIGVLAALELGGAVLSVAALSFLGFGAVPPTPEWGQLVNDGRAYIANAWWMTTLPGAVIALAVLAVNRLSRAAGVVER